MKPTIVLTRPAGDSDALAETLIGRGYPVHVQPVLQITPLTPDLIPTLPTLDASTLVIFISANAVHLGAPLLAEAIRSHEVTVLAVGAKTASALSSFDIEAVVPEQPNSEGLLALSRLKNLSGSRVVIVKGEGGRGLLASELASRGAEVIEFPCYRREPEPLDGRAFQESLTQDAPAGMIFQANSGETLTLVTELLHSDSTPNLLSQTVVVPSARVADQAKALGWQGVITAADASDDAFLDVLASLERDSEPADEAATESTEAPVSETDGSDEAPTVSAETETASEPEDDDLAVEDDSQDGADKADDGTKTQDSLPAVASDRGGDEGNTSTAPAAPAPKVKRADWFARLLALLAIVGMGGAAAGGYLFLWPEWQSRQSQGADLAQQLESFAQQSAGQATEVTTRLNNRMAEIQDSAKALRQELRSDSERQRSQIAESQRLMTERVNRLDLRLERMMATDRRGWLANEAAFLVRLAAQRLLASRDVEAAEALLTNADSLLAEADDPRLEAARRALATDRIALKAAERVDIVGLYAKLSALAGQAGSLAVVVAPESSGAPLPESASWLERAEAGWQAALAKLSDYLVIKRRDTEMARMMTPDWEALARQNLRMLIEQAQIAALSGNQVLFDTALERAALFIKEFSSTDPDRARAMLDEIGLLAQTQIAPELPDLLGSRSAIADAIRLLDGERNDQLSAPAAEG